ncbi:uncharacterized protein LACBIDRAFT_329906 [Laccaria bicolor S238N-H82]|uniref:Predicted protein n=1 Tax=Laccaria bicolor (strain S238N-H82 / ATCC MYA-4686) TaxID=486041 RepID=B0DJL0_LACBS|nr:uncharacterized protein LACBIDRAFT_329906 [Laccaria bicolor S238N-H82]EDR05136.1 predicted protein [Laccaria bicolor S238N-H82]|eukprot:XP_001884101.1 predicted protein [Laccaria bicolor S238N-H82]
MRTHNVATDHPRPLTSAQEVKTTWQVCHVIQTVTTHAIVTVQADQGPRRCLRRGNNSTTRHNNNRARPQQNDTTGDEDGATSRRNHDRPPTKLSAHQHQRPTAHKGERPPTKTSAHDTTTTKSAHP